MRATVNYASVRKMIEDRLFPEPKTRLGTYPKIVEKTGVIVFHGHVPLVDDPEKCVTFTRCRIHPDGSMFCKTRALPPWLQEQADQHGLPLDLVVIPPPPPQQKLPKNVKKAQAKPVEPHQPKRAVQAPKPATSLRDLLAKRKAEKAE